MKCIVAGSRGITSYDEVLIAIERSGFNITEVVSGNASLGVDRNGERWAAENDVPVTLFRANWAKQGRAAGKIRNSKMSKYGEALIAVWDGISPGTKDMIAKARYRGLRVYVHLVDINEL